MVESSARLQPFNTSESQIDFQTASTAPLSVDPLAPAPAPVPASSRNQSASGSLTSLRSFSYWENFTDEQLVQELEYAVQEGRLVDAANIQANQTLRKRSNEQRAQMEAARSRARQQTDEARRHQRENEEDHEAA